MNVTGEQIAAGQAIYTKAVLSLYDVVVTRASNLYLWRCPKARLVEHYNEHVTANHLDVGVGTGYYLNNCRFPSHSPRVILMDINQNSLDYAAHKISRFKPKTYLRNVLEPISIDSGNFDSIGINYLLHCIPGSIESKAVVFDHFKALMNSNAVFFGSTLLQCGVARNWFAKHLMDFYNARGIFSNRNDNLEGLKRALTKRFRDVSVEVVGCVALFSGRV